MYVETQTRWKWLGIRLAEGHNQYHINCFSRVLERKMWQVSDMLCEGCDIEAIPEFFVLLNMRLT